MQKAFQMLPHHTCATLLGGECERGILIQQVQVLRAYWPWSTKYLHWLAYRVCAAKKMHESLSIEVHVETPVCRHQSFGRLPLQRPNSLCTANTTPMIRRSKA